MNPVKDMEKELPTIYAVDFDGTLVEDAYPMIGNIRETMWDAIVKAQKEGVKLILWTSRNGQQLQEAVEFCANCGLHFDAINENLDEVKVRWGGDTRKIFADMYIDDRMAGFDMELEEFMYHPLEFGGV